MCLLTLGDPHRIGGSSEILDDNGSDILLCCNGAGQEDSKEANRTKDKVCDLISKGIDKTIYSECCALLAKTMEQTAIISH